jgi:hypothetical protein
MASFPSSTAAPAALSVIYAMGFDQELAQQALTQAGGNEELAIHLILNGEVHHAAADSFSTTCVAALAAGPSVSRSAAATGSVAVSSSSKPSIAVSSSSKPSIALSFTDHFIGRRVSLCTDAEGYPLPPAGQRAQIKRPLELMKAAAWFFERRSPGIKRHREEPPMPLGHMLTEFPPSVPVRLMFGCVATACRRLATAPASMKVFYRTMWRWAGWIMERATRCRGSRVQVRLQRRASCVRV